MSGPEQSLTAAKDVKDIIPNRLESSDCPARNWLESLSSSEGQKTFFQARAAGNKGVSFIPSFTLSASDLDNSGVCSAAVNKSSPPGMAKLQEGNYPPVVFQGQEQAEVTGNAREKWGDSTVAARQSADLPQDKPVEGKPVDISALKSILETTFNRIDENNNGFLSYDEMTKAIADPSFKGNQAILLGLLRLSFPQSGGGAALLHPDSGIDLELTKGVSLQGAKLLLGLLDMSQKEGISLAVILDKLRNGGASEKFWNEIDRNNDAVLTKDELKAAASSKNLPDDAKEAASIIEHNLDFLARLHEDGDGARGVSIEDMRELLQECQTLERVEPNLQGYLERQRAMHNISTDLFADMKDPLKSIRPEAVKQGFVGSCFFLSAVAVMAASDPERLAQMITARDGGYRVRFPGANGIEVTVPALTETEMALYSGCSKYGTWVGVLEKAYGQLLARHAEFRPRGGYIDAPVPENLDGGGFDEALKMLSGSSTDQLLLENSTTISSISERFAQARENSEMAIAGTRSFVLSKDLQPCHSYAILASDGKTVTLRNTTGVLRLGKRNGIPFERQGDNGNINIPFEDFARDFSAAYFAPSAKTPAACRQSYQRN